MKKVHLGIEIFAGDATNMLRIMLFVFKSPNGAGTPSLANVLDPTAATGNEPLAQRYWNDRTNYRMLYDKVFTVHTYKPFTRILIHKRIPKRFQMMTFRANAGLSTDIDTNMLLLGIISDSNAAPSPSWQYTGRVTYQDA